VIRDKMRDGYAGFNKSAGVADTFSSCDDRPEPILLRCRGC